MHTCSAATVLALSLFAGSSRAEALTLTAGPQVAWALGEGPTLGWEAGGGWGTVRLNAGQMLERDLAGETRAITYLVLEPWFYVGATLGFAYSREMGTVAALGLWEGLPLRAKPSCVNRGDRGAVIVTVAVGYRWIGRHEIYFTPKIGWSALCP